MHFNTLYAGQPNAVAEELEELITARTVPTTDGALAAALVNAMRRIGELEKEVRELRARD